MPPRNSEKNKEVLKDLEKNISPVLVVNNPSLKPYVELFEYEPENIYQQPLGSLVGFFEVKEYSDESAYVVNFLTSVLKKEYYINPKRQVTESLDSALHKVNLALSELAKNGNVEWLGKIHAAICVLEKNNAHFSVSGDAKIFLYRNQILSEISADLASDTLDPHPLKTFVNVSSGRLEKNDRMLITTEDIFHILPAVEIKKNFQRFQGDKFVQFLKTALSNQMEMIASIVVDLNEAMPIAKSASNKNKSVKAINAFSGAAFPAAPEKTATIEEIEQEIPTENKPENEEHYTDKKTGHIYIQGESNENTENSNAQMGLYVDMFKERISSGSYVVKNEIRKRFSLYKKQLAKKKESRRLEKEKQLQLEAEQAKIIEEQRVITEMEREQRIAQEKEFEKARLEQERIEQEKIAAEMAANEKKVQKISRLKAEPEEVEITKNDQTEIQSEERELTFMEKLQLAKMEAQRNTVIDLRGKGKKRMLEIKPANIQETEIQQEDFEQVQEDDYLQTKTIPDSNNVNQNFNLSDKIILPIRQISTKLFTKEGSFEQRETLTKRIVPHFSKIKNLFSRFSFEQKMYTLGALILIFIVPLFIVHFLNQPKAPTITDLPVTPPSQTEILAREKNINTGAIAESVYANSGIISTLIANENPTIITKTSVIVLQNNQPKEFPLPAGSGTPIRATYMHDLSLVLILTDTGKVSSFSPISTKYADNNINLDGTSTQSFIGTYLTYLYLLDQKTNQIYRYPRADGGFGEKTSWLKDSTTLTGVTDMTIDDNIYAIQNNQVIKFFKGKAVPFSLEISNTPVHFDKIYTTPDLQNLYALDNENSRIVEYTKDGSIFAQFHNDKIKDGNAFSVDEKNKTAYIATSSELISVSLQ